MTQMNLRLPDDVARRVKQAANARGVSLNRWATSVLQAAVDPDLAGDEAARVRERLARAGLLASPPTGSGRRPAPAELARARAASGRGRQLSELVAEGRG